MKPADITPLNPAAYAIGLRFNHGYPGKMWLYTHTSHLKGVIRYIREYHIT